MAHGTVKGYRHAKYYLSVVKLGKWWFLHQWSVFLLINFYFFLQCFELSFEEIENLLNVSQRLKEVRERYFSPFLTSSYGFISDNVIWKRFEFKEWQFIKKNFSTSET